MNIWALQVMLQRFELNDKQWSRIYANHFIGTLTQHAPTVIAVTTADIEYALSGQWAKRGLQAIPFKIRSPLGIDSHVE